MQIWQLFIILKQPVGTVFSNLTKLTNYLFICTIKIWASLIRYAKISEASGFKRKYNCVYFINKCSFFINGGIVSEQKRLSSLVP